MVKLRRHELAAEARRRNLEQLSRLGADLREARTRRRLTQAEVGDRVGLGRSTVGAIERGQGGGHTLDTWQRLGLAVGRPLRIELGRDVLEAPADAGHLAIQELLLRLRRAAGFTGTFELPIRPADTRHAIDVCLRDDGQRLLRLCEAWNTFGDIGAAVPVAMRKSPPMATKKSPPLA